IGQTSGIYPWQQPLLEVFDANDNFLQALRIESVDIAASTLTVVAGDAATSDPALHGDTVLRWKVTQRPTLVLVDPLNSRLGNQKATIVGTYDEDKTILELDCKLGDLKVNKDCDTIYLAADTNRASKRYRIIRGAYGTQSDNAKKRNRYDHSVGTNPSTDGAITQLGNGKKRILVAGLPAFAEGTTESPWNIPAGLGGEINHPGKDYYSKKLTLGYDTTDGWMFVVYDGRVRLMQKWTSYTSRSHGLGSEQNSSIAGNKLYHYYSHRSGKKRTINYSLKVVDKPLTDWSYDDCTLARRYHLRKVTADDKGRIRIHHSSHDHKNGKGTGSAGCLVSRQYYLLRNELIRIYVREQKRLGVATALPLGALINYQTHLWGEKIWCNTANATVQSTANCSTATVSAVSTDRKLVDKDWIKKISGEYWLIRPEERSLGKITVEIDR
ncbi:MAG: hypothetical protein AAFN92_18875, partial [Bacteroidota bacterium]